MVTNRNGVEVSFDACVLLMADSLREEVHARLAPCSEQAFFDAYAAEHERIYGVGSWEPANPRPVM